MEGKSRHVAGECWCDIVHSVPGAAALNGDPDPEHQYDNIILRTTGQEDPLVQEPKS